MRLPNYELRFTNYNVDVSAVRAGVERMRSVIDAQLDLLAAPHTPRTFKSKVLLL